MGDVPNEVVHVSRGGNIYVDGEFVGRVDRSAAHYGVKWRARLLPFAEGEPIPVAYAKTRKAAVAAVLHHR